MKTVVALLIAAHCLTANGLTTAMRHQYPMIKEAYFEGEQARDFMLAFNKINPPTHFKADQVLVFYRDGYPKMELMLFRRGCMTQFAPVNADTVGPLIGRDS